MYDREPSLTISVTSPNTVGLIGELDAHSASHVEAALAALPTDGDIRLDLSALTFMDSSGVRVIVSACRRRRERGDELVLLRPGRAVDRLLSLSGLAEHLTIERGEDAARGRVCSDAIAVDGAISRPSR